VIPTLEAATELEGASGPLRIVVVAPPWYPVPPRGYGGIEAMCHLLVEGLVGRGHSVTLIGAGEARTSATYVRATAEPQFARLGDALPSVLHSALAAETIEALRPDLVHDHTLSGPLLARGRPIPTLVTAHGPATGELGAYYRALGTTVRLVAISDAQRRSAPDLPWEATVHNAVDVERFRFRAEKDDFLLFLGRMSPDKAPHLAAAVGRRTGRPGVIAAKCEERAERRYFDEAVRPLLGNDVEFVGQARGEDKLELLSRARALLMPIQWDEPFGLVMVEALASGTPVVGLGRGSVPEVVEDGRTGFVCASLDEMVEAVGRLDEIDPGACRRDAAARFDASVMVDGYEAAFRSAVASAHATTV
jgi:glycosyltransferase involved in cell wall biosynthesis